MNETDGTTSRLWRRQLPCGSSFHFRQTLGDNLGFSVDTPTEDRIGKRLQLEAKTPMECSSSAGDEILSALGA